MAADDEKEDRGDGRLVMTTVGSEEAAGRLGRSVVEAGLVACVQLLPIRSLYRWHGELVDEKEVLLLLKTTPARAAALVDAVKAEHPYEVPEIVELPMAVGSPDYLRWMVDQTAPSD